MNLSKLYNIKSALKSKVQLNEFTYELKYTIPLDFEFKPGQFVVLLVTPPYRRSYSIAEVKDGLMTLLVDVKPMGHASKYFINTVIGDETTVMGPYGLFSLQMTSFNKVFIATSTGTAPLMPMIKELQESNLEIFNNVKVDFFYGARNIKHDIAFRYFLKHLSSDFRYIRCITSPENNSVEYQLGRVTQIVPTFDYDYLNTEFYICGSPQMVEDMRSILVDLGADKIYFEKY